MLTFDKTQQILPLDAYFLSNAEGILNRSPPPGLPVAFDCPEKWKVVSHSIIQVVYIHLFWDIWALLPHIPRPSLFPTFYICWNVGAVPPSRDLTLWHWLTLIPSIMNHVYLILRYIVCMIRFTGTLL